MVIEGKISKAKPHNPLAGAIDIAIEKAERFNTSLVIKGKDGKIRNVSPAEMRRIVKKAKS